MVRKKAIFEEKVKLSKAKHKFFSSILYLYNKAPVPISCELYLYGPEARKNLYLVPDDILIYETDEVKANTKRKRRKSFCIPAKQITDLFDEEDTFSDDLSKAPPDVQLNFGNSAGYTIFKMFYVGAITPPVEVYVLQGYDKVPDFNSKKFEKIINEINKTKHDDKNPLTGYLLNENYNTLTWNLPKSLYSMFAKQIAVIEFSHKIRNLPELFTEIKEYKPAEDNDFGHIVRFVPDKVFNSKYYVFCAPSDKKAFVARIREIENRFFQMMKDIKSIVDKVWKDKEHLISEEQLDIINKHNTQHQQYLTENKSYNFLEEFTEEHWAALARGLNKKYHAIRYCEICKKYFRREYYLRKPKSTTGLHDQYQMKNLLVTTDQFKKRKYCSDICENRAHYKSYYSRHSSKKD